MPAPPLLSRLLGSFPKTFSTKSQKKTKQHFFFSFSKGWSCQEFTGRERPERNPGGEQIADSSILQTQTASVEHFEGVQT